LLDELLLEVVVDFFLCVVVLELCAYPTVTAAHNTAPARTCHPNPETFANTLT